MASTDKFEPYSVFKRIDVEGNKTVTSFDIYRYLRQKILDVSELDTSLIINYFDSDGDE